MNREELKTYLSDLAPHITLDETGEWPVAEIPANNWLNMATALSQAPLHFNYLFCLTCVDWKTHLSMVYHLRSSYHGETLVIKAKLDLPSPQISSVAAIWKTAIFHEREQFEMFGVVFTDHPDLRLLILPDGWEGRNPLRKDFEDPVNMIKL